MAVHHSHADLGELPQKKEEYDNAHGIEINLVIGKSINITIQYNTIQHRHMSHSCWITPVLRIDTSYVTNTTERVLETLHVPQLVLKISLLLMEPAGSTSVFTRARHWSLT